VLSLDLKVSPHSHITICFEGVGWFSCFWNHPCRLFRCGTGQPVISKEKNMPEQKLFNADEDDRLRCQGPDNSGSGQCRYKSLAAMDRDDLLVEVDTSIDYSTILKCPKHQGFQEVTYKQKKALHDYRLQVWQERIAEFSESDKVKTLRGEIGILRLLVEQTLNKCQDPTELMLYSGKIGDLVMKIEKLVRSCDRLESSMGMLLDRAGALVLAGEIVEIISTHVKDSNVIDQISSGIITAIADLTGEKQSAN